ncbi:MAG: 30S ribosomal protein S1, partial [Acidimicrobiia bacterium]
GGEVAAEYRDQFGEHAYDAEGNYIGPAYEEPEAAADGDGDGEAVAVVDGEAVAEVDGEAVAELEIEVVEVDVETPEAEAGADDGGEAAPEA